MWQINKSKLQVDPLDILIKLKSRLGWAEIHKDAPEWMWCAEGIKQAKLDAFVLPQQISKLEKQMADGQG